MSLFRFNFTSSKHKAGDKEDDDESTKPKVSKDTKYDREKRVRVFQDHWTEKWPWVKFDGEKEEMYCEYCRKFPLSADSLDAMTRGTKNLKTDPIKIHEKKPEHIACSKQWHKESNPSSAMSTSFCSTPLGQSLLKIDAEKRKRLEILFNTAYGVAKSGKPFSDFDLICDIQAKNGLDLGQNYRNIQGCKSFIKSIADSLLQTSESELKNANFVSILSDGSTDCSVIEQEIVYLRYVYESHPSTKVISAEAVENANAAGIFKALSQALEKIDLNFEKLKPCPNVFKKPSLICANFDGASVNLGQKSGVIAKIRDVIPNIMGLHCVAHKLELAVLDANKQCKSMQSFEETVKGIFNFYHYSPKRRREIQDIAQILDSDLSHMSAIKQVRWMASKARAIQALEKNLEIITTHLQHAHVAGTRADDSNRAKGYLKDVTSLSFLKYLYFLLDYLPVLTELSKSLQFEDLLIVEIPDMVEKTIIKLNALKSLPGKNMTKFSTLYNMGEKKLGNVQLSGKLSPVDFTKDTDIHKFIDNTVTYLKKRFENLSEVPLSLFQILNFHKWPLSVEELGNFGTQELADLLEHESVGMYFTDDEKEGIKEEWVGLKLQIVPLRTNPLSTVYTMIHQMKVSQMNTSNQVCHIAKLIEFMMTISPSTSACERGFSKMNVMKTKYRSTLNQEVFNNQLMIMQEGPDISSFEPESALNLWLTSGSGSRHIHGHRLSGPRNVEEPKQLEITLPKP